MAFSKKYRKRAAELYDLHSAMKTVLNELAKEFGDITLPDEKTIRTWTKSRPAYLENENITANPIILERFKEHQNELSKVAELLLDNDLDLIIPVEILGEKYYGEEIEKDKIKVFEDGWVTKVFKYNLENAREQFRPSDTVDMFEEHFKYEIKLGKNLREYMEEQPYELVKLLKILIQRRTFKGRCEVCKDW